MPNVRRGDIMERDPSKQRTLGIYLGGIGLLLSGIALLIWSITEVAMVYLSYRQTVRFERHTDSTHVTHTGEYQPESPAASRTNDIHKMVEFLTLISTNPAALNDPEMTNHSWFKINWEDANK